MYKRYLFEQEADDDTQNNAGLGDGNGDGNGNSNDGGDGNDDSDDKTLERENGEYADNNDELDKALTLMKQAIRQYQDGKFDLGRHTRILADKSFRKVDAEMDTEEGREKTMYGEDKNFGLIYRVLEENANSMYAAGTDALPRAVRMIRDDRVLRDQFDLYEAFVSPRGVKDPKAYVSEALNLVRRHPRKAIRESNTRLLRLLKNSGYVNEDIDVDKRDMLLFEAVEYALLNEKSVRNINQYARVGKVLCEAVRRNNRNGVRKADAGAAFEGRLEEAVARQAGALNEAEKELVMRYDRAVSKKALFEQMRDEALSALGDRRDGCGDSEQAEEIGGLMEKVRRKEFNEDRCLQDIAIFANITSELR